MPTYNEIEADWEELAASCKRACRPEEKATMLAFMQHIAGRPVIARCMHCRQLLKVAEHGTAWIVSCGCERSTPREYGKCPRHRCQFVTKETKLTTVRSPHFPLGYMPNDRVLQMRSWASHRYPFAYGYLILCRDKDSVMEHYCPRCRLAWHFVQWIPLPYTLFTGPMARVTKTKEQWQADENARRKALEQRMEAVRRKAILLGLASSPQVDGVLYNMQSDDFRKHFGEFPVSRAFFRRADT